MSAHAADFQWTVFTVYFLLQVINILDSEAAATGFYDTVAAQLAEQTVEAFSGHAGIIGKFLICEGDGKGNACFGFLAVAIGQTDEGGVKGTFFAVEDKIPEPGLMPAHGEAGDLQQVHGQGRAFFQMFFQDRKFYGINFGRALGDGIKNVGGLFLVEVQLAYEAAVSGQAEG